MSSNTIIDKRNDEFDIPAGNIFLKNLLISIEKCLDGSGIKVIGIDHHSYQEKYHFEKEQEQLKVNIYYNSSEKISNITPHTVNLFSQGILSLLEPIKGSFIQGPTIPKSEKTDEEDFEIHTTNPFLKNLLERIRKSLKESGIKVIEIISNSYLEIYSFNKGQEIVKINIHYKSTGEVSGFVPHTQSPFSHEILSALEPIKGSVIPYHELGAENSNFEFDEQFLEDYHNRLVSILERNGIKVSNIESREYAQRYTFNHDDDIAVFDFFYNADKVISTYRPFKPKSYSLELVKDIDEIIKTEVIQ
jgi:hypothetical protein